MKRTDSNLASGESSAVIVQYLSLGRSAPSVALETAIRKGGQISARISLAYGEKDSTHYQKVYLSFFKKKKDQEM